MASDGGGDEAVAVAVITCDLGVLIGQREDHRPPWTFPGGKVKADEDATAAAVREAREETGLAVVGHGELGRRVHPRTGRCLIYIACTVQLVDGWVDAAPDARELVAKQWAGLDEISDLMLARRG